MKIKNDDNCQEKKEDFCTPLVLNVLKMKKILSNSPQTQNVNSLQ